jgi:formate dehydrogenase assembly factor FdhD
MGRLTVDDDFSHGFSLTDGIASRADVASSIRNGDSTELHERKDVELKSRLISTRLILVYL